MANKIGALIALDGEKKFRDSIKNCNASIKNMKSEMKMLGAQYKGNEKSIDALSAKQKTLSSLLDQQKKKEQEIAKALESAKKNRDGIASGLEKLNKKYDEETKKLESIEKQYGKQSEEYKNQEKLVGEYAQAIEKGNSNLQRAEGRVTSWTGKLTDARTELYNTQNNLDSVNSELVELANDAAKADTNVDKLGDEMSDLDKGLSDAEKSGSGFKDIFAGNLVSDLAVSGLNKLKDAAVDAAKYIVEVGSSFEASMSKVQALSGASSSEYERMADKAKELGSSTQFSASEVADAFGYMALCGWDATKSIDAMDGVLNLAAASQMDIASVSNLVTNYLSAFGLEAKDAAKMADELAYAQANSNTSTEQLGEAFKNSAANMHANGQTMETTIALLEGLANQGIKGSEAGTKLTATMRDLNKKAQDGKVMIGDTAVAIADEAGNYRQLTDIIDDVGKATEGMTEIERTNALQKVFTQHSISAVNMLMTEGTEKVQGYADALDLAGGTAEQMATTMNDNLNGAMTALGSATEGLGIAAYEYFGDGLTTIVKGLTGAISGITTLLVPQKTALDGFIKDIEDGNTKVEGLLTSAKDTMKNSDMDVAELEYYKNVLLDLNRQGNLSELQQYQLKEAVNALGDSIPEVNEAFNEQAGFLDLSDQAIVQLIDDQEQYVKQTAMLEARKKVWEAESLALLDVTKSSQAAEKAKTDYEAANRAVTESMKEGLTYEQAEILYNETHEDTLKSLKATYDSANEALDESNALYSEAQAESQALETAYETLEEQSENTAKGQEELKDSTEDTGTAMEGLSTDAQNLINNYTNLANAMQESLSSQIDMLSDMSDAYFDASGTIKDENGEIQESLGGVAKEMQDNLQSQIDAVEAWSTSIEELAEKGIDEGLLERLAEMGPEGAKYAQALNSMSDDELTAYQKKWKTLLDEVDMEGTVGGALNQIAEKLAGGKDDLVKDMEEIGLNVQEGFAKGMNDNIQIAKDASEDTGDAVIDAIKTALDSHSPSKEMETVGQDAVQGLADGITDNEETATSASATMGEDVLSSCEESGANSDAFYEIGQYCASGLAGGIYDGASEAINAAIYMAQEALAAAQDTLQIHSPSRKFAQLGEYSAEGYAEGFVDEMRYGMDDITNAMQPNVSDIPRAYGSASTSSGATKMYAEIPIYVDGELVTKRATDVVIRNLSAQQAARMRGIA